MVVSHTPVGTVCSACEPSSPDVCFLGMDPCLSVCALSCSCQGHHMFRCVCLFAPLLATVKMSAAPVRQLSCYPGHGNTPDSPSCSSLFTHCLTRRSSSRSPSSPAPPPLLPALPAPLPQLPAGRRLRVARVDAAQGPCVRRGEEEAAGEALSLAALAALGSCLADLACCLLLMCV